VCVCVCVCVCACAIAYAFVCVCVCANAYAFVCVFGGPASQVAQAKAGNREVLLALMGELYCPPLLRRTLAAPQAPDLCVAPPRPLRTATCD
jgi:hypothetical protein